jgi:hypothetical protein
MSEFTPAQSLVTPAVRRLYLSVSVNNMQIGD